MPNIHDIRFRTFIKSNLLVILTLIGVIIGFSVGFGVRRLNPSKDALMWIGILGELYLNFLKMMVVPLIVSSIISGTASLDPRANGKIGLVGLAFIMATNFGGTLLGTILCIMINPGGRSGASQTKFLEKVDIQTQDVFADLLRNIIPDNLIASTFQITMTEYTMGEIRQNISGINGTISGETISYIKDKAVGKTRGINMIGILVICLIFGMATASMGKVGKPFYEFFYSATEIVLFILGKMMWTTPIGVCSLVMKEIARLEDLEGNFASLGIFIGTVTLALAVELFILCPLIYFVIVRKNPLKFLGSMTHPFLIVFATTMTLLVTLMSVALPPVPSGALITIVILLTAIGIPPEAAALLFAFEWFLDRMRASVNIYYQCLSSAVVQHFCKGMLAESDQKNNDVILDVIPSEEAMRPMLCRNHEEERSDGKEINIV